MSDEIEVFCGDEKFSVSETEIAEILRCLKNCAPWKFPAGTLSIAFLGDEEICRMHENFLDDPSKTDVITFPGDEIFSKPISQEHDKISAGTKRDKKTEGDAFAGEICVCVDQALRMSRELGTTPADEILLYLVHGWLHLAGFDDIEETDRRAMRESEKIALSLLREKNLAPLKTALFA